MTYLKEAWRSYASSFSCTCDDTKSLQKIKALLTEDLKDGDHAKISLNALMPSCKGFVDLKPGTSISSGIVSCQVPLIFKLRRLRGMGSIWLQTADKIILQRGDELSDKHIQFAQKLIKEQFPVTCGLISTPLQEKCNNFQGGSVQIIHCLRRHHWIAISNIGCNENSVNVYDSLFPDVDGITCTLIRNMFGGDECKISMKKVQVQSGIKDCGVFAIVFITSVVATWRRS